MAYVPKFRHLFKILFHVRDSAAAEGLFLEGSIEFEAGDIETARLMFYYGTRLDPRLAGNFYNLAVAEERLHGPGPRAINAWENYLAAAEHDKRQSAEAKSKASEHLRQLRLTLGRE